MGASFAFAMVPDSVDVYGDVGGCAVMFDTLTHTGCVYVCAWGMPLHERCLGEDQLTAGLIFDLLRVAP